MSRREIWYLCSPEKHPGCEKGNCYARGGSCMMTRNRAAAIKTGRGRAVLVIIRRRGSGFVRTLREEDTDGRRAVKSEG